MSCSFYDFRNGDYYCTKNGKYISSDIYYKYCRNYDYDDCPIYKDSGSSSGCYISSACVYALGCEDDCVELNTLRHFRDTFLKSLPSGKDDIKEYYAYAPLIVSQINRRKDKAKIYKDIFNNYIKKCLNKINEKKYIEAYNIYKEMYTTLKNIYLE